MRKGKTMARNLIGKVVDIINKDSLYYAEWGTIVAQDESGYHVAIANGRDSVPVFDRDEFKVRKEKK